MTEEIQARRLERERRARKEAEWLLEKKSRELYNSNQEYRSLAATLEKQVVDRTQDLADARDAALAASEAKSRLLAIMSHEIRSPLNAVIGALGLLNDMRLDLEQRGYLEVAATSAESLLTIANDILDYSRMEANKLTLERSVFDVRDMVAGVADSFTARCRDNSIDMMVEIDQQVPAQLVGDPTRIRQVLVNLVDNAFKFTREGYIRLAVAAEDSADDRVSLVFSVTDTGLGISEANKTRLFEEFFSWAPDSPDSIVGTGLGLAISKRLVSMMEGEIDVDSKLGKGSTFGFRLPFESPAESVSESTESLRATPDSTRAELSGLVLLAEDDKANRMVVQAMLIKSGLNVDVVGNGLEALNAARKSSYDVVLMDIDMPVMGGLEATQKIRALPGDKARTPIVAMTAHAMRGDREKFLAEGLDDYIVKPLSRDRLVECLEQWLCVPGK